MIFTSLDDKQECVGVYVEGKLHFDDLPTPLSKTWKYAGWHPAEGIEYGWFYTQGLPLREACPEHLEQRLASVEKKLIACMKALKIARISFREHCLFDLIPSDFLMEFNEIKTQIIKHVFETCEKPAHYDHLCAVERLLYKIRYQPLNLNNENCKELFYQSHTRNRAKALLQGNPYIDYNIFGTITGRLTTHPECFPILTLKKELRQLIKPHNDWFVSLDYNGAEARTVMDLAGNEQPIGDIHEWNMKNLFGDRRIGREEAKTLFFSWLYNPESEAIETKYYDRESLLEEWYVDGHIYTPYGRSIKVDRRRAFNYLIQSTTSDRVLQKAVKLDELLTDRKSWISHVVHDEVVIDLADEDRDLLPQIKEIFEDGYRANLQAGRNYLDLEDLKI